MIVIATAGDPTADALNGYAHTFVSTLDKPCTIWLDGAGATAAAIDLALGAHPGQPAFLFGHGAPSPSTGFRATCGNLVLDNLGITRLLPNRVVVGSFCDGQQVGAQASQVGFSMFGYRGGLVVPLWPQHAKMMEAAALAGPRHVAQGGSVRSAASVAARAYAHLAYRLNMSRSYDDFMAALVISINDPTYW